MNTCRLIIIALGIVLLGCYTAPAQRKKSVLLPPIEANRLAKQCSRPSPDKYTDTWIPSAAVIKEMESKFTEIKKLSVKECCIQGAQIEDPEEYYMQYAGLIVNGKKLVYISAFTNSEPRQWWKKTAVVICDGGDAWGVLYDPKEKEFFDLAINGIG